MKNLAKNIAIAITLLAVFFVGCKNTVDAVIDTSDGKKTNSLINELTVVATSDDALVDFSESRTILPGALKADELTFYLWGTDVNDNTNTSINKPAVVQFNQGNDASTGTVPVSLNVSSYKLKLAAVITGNGLPTVTGTAAEAITNVMAKAVVYAVADVDLRYNQTVKFFLSPANITGTGSVDILVRTAMENGTRWSNKNYSVTVRIEDKVTNAVVSTVNVPTTTAITWYNVGDDWTTASANAQGTEKKFADDEAIRYKFDDISAGSYNFVIDFFNGSKHFYYSDTLMILTGQKSNKTNNGSVDSTDPLNPVYYLEVPDVINTEPTPPSDLIVGYTDPTDRENGNFLATFEWTDNSYNEEFFYFELMDITNCTTGTHADAANKTGFDDETYEALTNSTTGLMFQELGATPAATNEVATQEIPDGWKALAAHTGTVKYTYRETIYQDVNTMYAAGSLNKNATSLSLWLELGHSYVARITAINEASGVPDADFDASTASSANYWIYTNQASMTTDAPRSGTLSTSTAGIAAESFTPLVWTDPDVDGEGDDDELPIAINRLRIDYSLNGGSFQAVDLNGIPTSWDSPAKVTDITGLERVYGRYITQYANVNLLGTPIIDPTIWADSASGSTTPFVTVYKGSLSFKAWYKDKLSGDPYSKINWDTNAASATESVVNGAGVFVASKYGKVNVKSNVNKTYVSGDPSTTLSADGILYTNKVMDAEYYTQAGNLFLVANYGSDSGAVSIDNPEYYKPHTQNIRVFKSTGAMNATYPFTSSTGGDVSNGKYDQTAFSLGNPVLTSPVDYPGSYTDGEVSKGTFKISSFWKTISIVLVENSLKASNTDIWKAMEVEFISDEGFVHSISAQGKKTTFVAYKNGSTVLDGSGKEAINGDNWVKTDGTVVTTDPASNYGDPLVYYIKSADSIHNAYYINADVSSFTPGKKYTAVIKAFTDEAKKNPPYEYNVSFEVTEPEYAPAAYTEVPNTTDVTNVTQYYIKSGNTYITTDWKPSNNPDTLTLYYISAAPKY